MTICSLSAIITGESPRTCGQLLLLIELGVVRGGAGKHQAQLSKHEITVYWKVRQQN